jgi:hypothetical protein
MHYVLVCSLCIHHYIVDPPTVEPIQNSSIIEKDNFTKICRMLDGNPTKTTVTWARDTKLVSFGEYLNIIHVQRSDDGYMYYSCSASNTMQYSNGSILEVAVSRSFYLSVQCKYI